MASIVPAFIRKDRSYDLLRAYWRGPHGFLVSQTDGLFSYIRHPFDKENCMAELPYDVDTTPKEKWIFDGIAETYMDNLMGSLKALTSGVSKETYKDEQNIFSRTLMYNTMPGDAIFYRADLETFDVPGKKEGERVILFIKSSHRCALKKFLTEQLMPTLCQNDQLREIASYVFMRFSENLWKSENVAHDHPEEEQFAAAVMLGAEHLNQVTAALYDAKVVELINANKDLFKAIYAFNNTESFVMRYNNHPTESAICDPHRRELIMEFGADNQLTDIFKKRVNSKP